MTLKTKCFVFALCLVAAVRSEEKLHKTENFIGSITQNIDELVKIIKSETNDAVSKIQTALNSTKMEKVNGTNKVDHLPPAVQEAFDNALSNASKNVLETMEQLNATTRDLLKLYQHLKGMKSNITKRSTDASKYKIAVDVFYESLCPDSRNFIKYQLAKSYFLHEPYIDLTLVPFGKSQSTDQGFQCQHGPAECLGNMVMSCALNMLPPGKEQLKFTECYMERPYGGRHLRICADQVGVSVEAIENCSRSTTGHYLQLKAEKDTKMLTPGPRFVPTVVINKVYNDYDQNEVEAGRFVEVLCRYLRTIGQCLDKY